jgi:uncharacterized protein YndB with AHSA1/START domain
MFDQDFTTTFSVEAPAGLVFAAINDVRGWWGEDVEGSNATVGDQFTYRVAPVHYSRLEVVELVPHEKVAWRVVDNHLDYIEDQAEWLGTTIVFELTPKAGGTEVRFEHRGLASSHECYEICSTAWGTLMHESLASLITTGTGQPFPRVLAQVS